jgi:ComF family protein
VEKISTLGPYGNPVWRKTIQLLKFQRVRDVADLCGAQMAQYLVDSQVYTPANAVLIPIPLHPARQRERGFNQAELLAQVMHRRTGIPMVTQALVRTVHAASQTGFSVAERQQRMHGMFRVTQRASVINGKHVLLIDDVVTTGATAGAAAAALVTAGPKTIHIVAVAHGG